MVWIEVFQYSKPRERMKDGLCTHKQMVKTTKWTQQNMPHNIIFCTKGKTWESGDKNFQGDLIHAERKEKQPKVPVVPSAYACPTDLSHGFKMTSFHTNVFLDSCLFLFCAAWHEFSTDVKGLLSPSSHVRSHEPRCWKGGQCIDLYAGSCEIYDSFFLRLSVVDSEI